ncbi:hypothetical protein BH09PAT1_BH09PAT1_4360 [soil metagenome]
MGRKEDAEKLYIRMKDWLTTYDHLFLLDPSGVPYKTDEIRKESNDTRMSFHKSFLELLSNSELPFTLIRGNKNARIGHIMRVINSDAKNDTNMLGFVS